jgi:Na+/melibiose symporter-like transporter
LVGWLGGVLTEEGRISDAFLICALCSAGAAALALTCVREPADARAREPFRAQWRLLRQNLASPAALRIVAFLFLWNFNPFSSSILQLHWKGHLGLGDDAYGMTKTLFAAGSLAGCAAFPALARRVPRRALAHTAIVLGIASTLAYWGLRNETSAGPISLFAGLTYMIATLIQLDLAAQACSPRVAGTMFALFMSVANLSASLATWAGGVFRDLTLEDWGAQSSYDALVAVGALFTAGCWFALPKDSPRDSTQG